MRKRDQRIYIDQWLELKPYDQQAPTDAYFLKLSNKVKEVLLAKESYSFLFKQWDEPKINLCACFLSSYFEDLISGSNLWNAFINTHKQLYNSFLPFYDTTEYYEEEINWQDINFLIWYFLNTIQNEHFLTPISEELKEVSLNVLSVFEEAWETAPENEHLKSYYQIDDKEPDYYQARKFIDTILFNSYLFYTDTTVDLRQQMEKIFEESENPEEAIRLGNSIKDHLTHHTRTKLLALTGKEWAAAVLGDEHPLSEAYLNMSEKVVGYFFCNGQDHESIFLEHVATGREFKLTQKSIDNPEAFADPKSMFSIGLVNWQDEWWFSGMLVRLERDLSLINEAKTNIDHKIALNFLDRKSEQVKDILDKQHHSFLKFNNQEPIAFLKADEIDDFMADSMEFYNKSLKLSRTDRKAAKTYLEEFRKEKQKFPKDITSGLAFFNPNSGIEIALDANSAFPAANNPFFNADESENHIMHLLVRKDHSTELAKYCIDNYKDQLPFFSTKNGKLYLDNADFLMRFWKVEKYLSFPEITLV